MAHGIASTVNDKRVVIGSAHFIFEDEGCVIPAGEEERFEHLPLEYSHNSTWQLPVSLQR